MNRSNHFIQLHDHDHGHGDLQRFRIVPEPPTVTHNQDIAMESIAFIGPQRVTFPPILARLCHDLMGRLVSVIILKILKMVNVSARPVSRIQCFTQQISPQTINVHRSYCVTTETKTRDMTKCDETVERQTSTKVHIWVHEASQTHINSGH